MRKNDGTANSSTQWETLLAQSCASPEFLADEWDVDVESLKRVVAKYPMRINPYLLELMRTSGSAVGRQFVPDVRELEDASGLVDPLAEERDSPVPNLTHRYPDRVLFLVSDACAAYCRFCTRKRKIGRGKGVTDAVIQGGIRYIRDHGEVRDVLLSGGDPLLLSDERLEWILAQVRAIPHVDIIRIGTRILSVLPHRITPGLVRVLQKYQPVYVNTHFNHPDELSEASVHSVRRLADAGIPLCNQTVLLRGINDDPICIENLMRWLLKERVKPYYLHQGDLTRGTGHFRTPLETGIRIMDRLRGRVSGLAVPTFVVDLPGGGGKVPLLPEYALEKARKRWVFRNYQGGVFYYPQVPGSEEDEQSRAVNHT